MSVLNTVGSVFKKKTLGDLNQASLAEAAEANGWVQNAEGEWVDGNGNPVRIRDYNKYALKNGLEDSHGFTASQYSGFGNTSAALDSGVRALPSFPQESSGAAAANGLFDNAASIMDKIPGAEKYAAAIKMAKFAGDIGAAAGITNDGMTKWDQFTQTGVGNLVGGMLLGNNIFTKKTQDFGADEETLENVGGSYGGTASDIYAAADKAGKKYGWMSGRRRKKDNREITEANFRQRQLEQISRDASDASRLVDFMSDAAKDAYAARLMGGYDQSAIHVGEEGGKIDLKEKKRMTGQAEDKEWRLPRLRRKIGCPASQFERMRAVIDRAGLFGSGMEEEREEVIEEVLDEFEPVIRIVVKGIAEEAADRMACSGANGGIDGGAFMLDEFEPVIRMMERGCGEFEPVISFGEHGGIGCMPHGAGVSCSGGTSRIVMTKDVPGVGPVTVVEERRMRPRVRTFGLYCKAGGKTGRRERIEKQLDAPDIEQSGQMNLIPEGALHKNRHHMEGAEEYTKKGIPVVDLQQTAEQEAEIEREEIIFNKEVTNELEELYRIYYDEKSTPEEKDNAALEAGKLITREVMLNTDDRTGLIGRLRKGGKMQDGGTAQDGMDAAGLEEGGQHRPTYEEWAKDISPDFFFMYDLERAYEMLPYEMMENWKKAVKYIEQTGEEPDAEPESWHLPSVCEDENGDYVFLKKGRTVEENPELQYEFEYYASDPDFSGEFKMVYDDKNGNWMYVKRGKKD